MNAPTQDHLEAAYRVIRNLKGCLGKVILYKNSGHCQVKVYTDADWAGSGTYHRSTSEYYTFLGGNLVTWRSKKQSVVARSNAEAEFQFMAHSIYESLWLKMLLAEVSFPIV